MKADTLSFYRTAVQDAVERIAGRLDEAVDLGDLAAMAHTSPFHFHRIFRGVVGETPLELARRLRLERAAWRLWSTDRPVAAIAHEAGYETHEAFTRGFRARYAAAPSEFRRRSVVQVELPAPCGVHFSSDGRVPVLIARETGGRTMDVEIMQLPDQRVAALRHVGPYSQVGRAFAELGAIAGAFGLEQGDGPRIIGIYHDDPESTPPEQLRADAGILVDDGVALPEGLSELHLPAGTYGRCVHTGSYTLLGDTWARLLGEWLPASGFALGDGPSYEQYVNTPGEVPEEELQTVIYVPLAQP